MGDPNSWIDPLRLARCPVPDKTKTQHGLYQSNSKHTLGGQGNNPKAGIEPRNSLDLFKNSRPNPKDPDVRYAFKNGEIHRFSGKNGLWHWSGTTDSNNVPLKAGDIPIDIRRSFGFKSKGRW